MIRKNLFVALAFLVCSAAANAQTSGTCGNGVNWEVTGVAPDYTLTISWDGAGTGEMTDFPNNPSVPFYAYRNDLTTLIIEEGITHIGIITFSGCSNLTGNLVIPNSVLSIGGMAFSGCSGFTGTLIIPNSVASIGDDAFQGCSGFTELIIGNLVNSIGNSAFFYCSGLQKIISLATSPPTVGTGYYNSFQGVPTTIPVYVPCGSLSNYPTTWSSTGFTNYNCGNLNYLLTVFSNDYSLGDASYSFTNPAVLYATPKPSGIFTQWSDGNTDNPRTVTLTSDSTFTAIFVANITDSLLQKIMDYELQITGLENDTALCNNNVLALLEQIDNLETDTAALNLQIAGLENDLDDCELDKILLQALLYACQSSLDSCLNGLTGTKSLQSPPMFRVYPNPVSSNGILNIENETLQAGDKIEIYDMSGKLLSINYASGTETAIKIGALPSGTYLLRLAGQRGVKFEVR